jgi:ubiquinone/menaquinone biosynthesis C-methylase UbiE
VTETAHRIAAQPFVYDLIQRLAGAAEIRTRLQRWLGETAGYSVLDVGAGTGLYVSCFPPSARYVWLDNDPQKLAGFRHAHPDQASALLGDGSALGLRDLSVDYASCVNATHHFDDTQLAAVFAELARVVRRGVILQDAVKTPRLLSRALWSLDRGSHPRTADALLAMCRQSFEIQAVERFVLRHEFVLVRAVPRR